MSVRMLKFKVTPYGTYEAGQVVAGLPSHLEYQLMESGDAASVEVTDFAAAVVGAAGIPIAQADLSTTTGVADTLYEISDGDSRGAKIVWAVPEGASVATWCWWLWPQSAVEI